MRGSSYLPCVMKNQNNDVKIVQASRSTGNISENDPGLDKPSMYLEQENETAERLSPLKLFSNKKDWLVTRGGV